METASSLRELYQQIKLRKMPFFGVFFLVVLGTYAVLYMIDFIPEPINSATSVAEVPAADALPNGGLIPKIDEPETPTTEVVIKEVSPLPHTIIFDSLDGKTLPVLNPTSRAVADLDASLLTGVVRHPDSADFEKVGNIFILGHSSYLPNVINKNFQAFNRIQELTWGDTVRLQSDDREYTYRVERVYKAKASDLVVPNTWGEANLTLATCNSFGSKDDRYIVEATLVKTTDL